MTRIFVSVLIVLVTTLANEAFEIQPRIVNGLKAKTADFPFFAFLQSQTGNLFKSCGASLISDEWLITAAHCVVDITNLTAHFGLTHLKKPSPLYVGFVIPNDYIYVHPSYYRDALNVPFDDIGI